MASRALGDYVDLQRGTTYQSALLGKPGPLLLGLGSIARNGGFKHENLKTYGGDSDARILLKAGDIYVSLKDVTQSADLLGAIARVPENVVVGRLTQDTVKLVFKRPDAPELLIYWALRTPQYREYCRAHSTGTTNLGLPRGDFLAFPIPDPTPARLELASLLQAVDAKIDLNRRMNDVLAATCHALFHDWFVEFGPTRAKAAGAAPYLSADLWELFPALLDDHSGFPVHWTPATLDDVAMPSGESVHPDALDPQTPYIGLEHMPRNSIALNEWAAAADVSSGKLAFKQGDFLFGKLRPYFHKVGVAAIDGICSTDIVALKPRTEDLRAFVLCCISTSDFVGFADRTADGTKMPRTSWSKMSKYGIAKPSEDILRKFEELAGPMLNCIKSNIHESRALAVTRNNLLPTLLDGLTSTSAAHSPLSGNQ